MVLLKLNWTVKKLSLNGLSSFSIKINEKEEKKWKFCVCKKNTLLVLKKCSSSGSGPGFAPKLNGFL